MNKRHVKSAIAKFTKLANKYDFCEHNVHFMYALAEMILEKEITPEDFGDLLHGSIHIICDGEELACDAEKDAEKIIKKAKDNLK